MHKLIKIMMTLIVKNLKEIYPIEMGASPNAPGI